MERRTKTATRTGIYLLLVTAIIVIANVISYEKYARLDTTKQELFTLSKGSKRMVCEGLSKELTVDFYVTRGLAKTDLFIDDVTRLFKEYEKAEYTKDDGTKSPPSKFRFNVIEPKTDDEKKAAKKVCDGKPQPTCLQEQMLGGMSETSEQATLAGGFLGFAIKYGSETLVIPTWPPNSSQGLEFFISNKIREIRDMEEKRESRYGVITGKEEIKLSDNFVPAGGQPASLKNILDHYFPFYKFVDVDLKNGDEEIDKGLLGLIITQPKKDYTEKELRRIDESLMSGNKAVVFYVSAVNINGGDKDMKATLNTHGLEKLFDGYGVEMKREAAIDFASGFQQGIEGPLGDEIYFVNYAVPVLTAEDGVDEDEQLLNQGFPAFFRMQQIVFPFPSPLVLHQDRQPESKMTVVARTSPYTSVYAADNMTLRHDADWKETEPQEQKIVGVAIDGTIRSAFAGKGDNMGIAAAEKSDTSRVLLLSSSQFLTDPFTRAGNPPPLPPQLQMMGGQQGDPELMFMARAYFEGQHHLLMLMSLKGTLDWMANDADLVAVNQKLLSESSLTYSKNRPRKPLVKRTDTEEVVKLKMEEFRKAQEAHRQERTDLQSRIKWWLVLLPAALIALFGIVRWRLREANRDKILI